MKGCVTRYIESMLVHDKKTIIFWVLVVSIFLIVFLFWLPGFIQSISTLVQSVGAKTEESTSALENTVTPQIEELKNAFDTLLKKIPTEQNAPAVAPPSGTVPAKDGSGIQSEKIIPSEGRNSKEVQSRQHCEQAGGISQQRTSGNRGAYAVCIFSDGSECEQTLFQSGTCKEGQTMVAEDLMDVTRNP